MNSVIALEHSQMTLLTIILVILVADLAVFASVWLSKS